MKLYAFVWRLLLSGLVCKLDDGNDGAGGGDPLGADMYREPAMETPDDNSAGGDDAQQQPSDAGQQSPAAPQPKAAGGLSEEQLIAIATRAAQAGMQQQQPAAQQPQTPKAPSPEEVRKMLNFYQVDADTMAALFGLDDVSQIHPTRVQKMNEVLQGIAKQSVTMAAHHFQTHMTPVQEQMQTFQQERMRQIEERAETAFTTTYPDLAKPELRELLLTLKDNMLKSGQKWPTIDDFSKDLATRARQLLQKVGSRPAAPAAPRGGGKSKPATGSLGSTGGSAGGGSAARSGTLGTGEDQVRNVWAPRRS